MIDTSSFFWLGLVGAVFVGLVMALCRARLAREPHRPRRHVPQQSKPELWDVHVSSDEWKGETTNGIISAEWGRILPLALCTFAQDTSIIVPPIAPPRRRRKSPFTRKKTPEAAAQPEPTSSVEAQVTTIVIFPSPRKPASSNVPGNRESSGSGPPDELQQEYAIATAWVRGPNPESLETTS